ncbi:MAG TPA: hypothetical protein VMP08_23020 [Anaerolineae bacterium]|nr:hypothetical protein [Anaerolineae bacterium]
MVESLKLSWSRAVVVLSFGLLLGLFFGVTVGLVCGLSLGLFGGGIGLSLELIPKQTPAKTKPNQGVWQSLRSPLFGGLIAWLAFGLVVGLVVGLADGLASGLFVGQLMMLILGEVAFIQHFVLRFILWRKGYIPPNYVRFLDYVAEHIFLRKVGGGYIFNHRMLQEYFAKLEKHPSAESDQFSPPDPKLGWAFSF